MRFSVFILAMTLCAAGCGESHMGGPDAGLLRLDAPGADDTDVPLDTPAFDTGPVCGPSEPGHCPSGATCLSCPSGPISEQYLCTTTCMLDTDCTDAARPLCNRDSMLGGMATGICTRTDFVCSWGVRCASPDTLIATPSGERRIADLREGDVVYSVEHGALWPVRIALVSSTPVVDHRVMRVTLATGVTLEISPGHPTADGRFFGDLRGGDALDGIPIVSAELAAYGHAFTYDILPESETGTYVAGGALIGSTLGP